MLLKNESEILEKPAQVHFAFLSKIVYNNLVVMETIWQKKSDSVCFIDNTNNVDTPY